MKHWLMMLAAVALAAFPSVRAADGPLSLDDAVRLAEQHSKVAQLARARLDEAGYAAALARQQRYPHITAYGLGGYYFRPVDLKIRQGSLTSALDAVGMDLGLGPLSAKTGPFPSEDMTLVHGSRTQWVGGLTLLQPLTQQWRIASGVRAAEAGRTGAQREAAQMLARVRFSVEELFAGVLVEDARLAAAAAKLAYQERRLRDAENAVTVGEALDETALGQRAVVIQARTEVTRSEQQRARLALQLGDLIGRPAVEDLPLAPELPERLAHPLAYWVGKAAQNPDRQIAAALAERAGAGVRAARQAHIPDVSAFATGFTQDGFPLAPSTGGMVGITLSWDVFDFGRRDAEIARSRAQQRAANLDRDRREEDAARELRVAFQDYAYAGELFGLAKQAADYRRRAAELSRQSAANGLALDTKALGAEADLRQAEADITAARIQRHLALLRLYLLAGEL